MEEKIKTFEECKVGDSLWLYYGSIQIKKTKLHKMFEYPNGYEIDVEHPDGRVYNLYPRFKPTDTFGGNYYTTREEAQSARNAHLEEEISRLEDKVLDVKKEIKSLKLQIIK